MLQIHNFEGKSKEEVLEKALEVLDVTEDAIMTNFTEVEAKLFKSKKYELKVLKNEDLKSYIKNFFETISDLMEIDINCEIQIREDILKVNLITSDNSIIIGKEGRTLNSFQQLLRQALNNQTPFNIKVTVDVSGYRSKKIKNLEYDIKNIAKEVLISKVDVKLDAMNSYERRIVHTVIGTYDELETESIGREPNRYIIIRYKEK
ncbi:MAG: KH domain-containing protein [Bacilli bacterium]|nr:KH domain-containing protein [Bacilli bacterium]MDD4547260.1 KH domain-containing protein [Bacilli bacterium]